VQRSNKRGKKGLTKREAKRAACRIVAQLIQSFCIAEDDFDSDDYIAKVDAALYEVEQEMKRRGGEHFGDTLGRRRPAVE